MYFTLIIHESWQSSVCLDICRARLPTMWNWKMPQDLSSLTVAALTKWQFTVTVLINIWEITLKPHIGWYYKGFSVGPGPYNIQLKYCLGKKKQW